MHDLCLNTTQPTGNPIVIPMEDDLANTAEHPFVSVMISALATKTSS